MYQYTDKPSSINVLIIHDVPILHGNWRNLSNCQNLTPRPTFNKTSRPYERGHGHVKSVWVTYIITLSNSMYEPSMMSLDCRVIEKLI